MVGNGKGSWIMRGQQLGAALGARVSSNPTAEDCAWADVIVLVKRGILQFGRLVARTGKPIVWDALDFWAQPAQNTLTPGAALAEFDRLSAIVQPVMTIGATKAMASAIGGVYLPHHSWSGLIPTPAREHVTTVAYQGGAVFLGVWRERIERLCAARGWTFVVNPTDLSDADLIVAFRDGPWDGWICREWKSGVKAVNAIAAGRPFICQPSAAANEICPPGVLSVETVDDLSRAFDLCAPEAYRSVIARGCGVAQVYTVNTVATQYAGILQAVVSERAVAC